MLSVCNSEKVAFSLWTSWWYNLSPCLIPEAGVPIFVEEQIKVFLVMLLNAEHREMIPCFRVCFLNYFFFGNKSL